MTPPSDKPTRAEFGLSDAGTLSRDDQNRIEQGLAEKIRSYGIDALDLSKATRLALDERLHSFWQDTLACSEDELDDRMRGVASVSLSIPRPVVATLNAERKYLAALKNWHFYQTNLANRTQRRASGARTPPRLRLRDIAHFGNATSTRAHACRST